MDRLRRLSSQHLERGSRALRDVALDDLIPLAARLEQQLSAFAYGTAAAVARQVDLGDGLDLRYRVADGDRQSDRPHDPHVRKVIADERRLLHAQVMTVENALKRRELAGQRILCDVVDLELVGTNPHAF